MAEINEGFDALNSELSATKTSATNISNSLSSLENSFTSQLVQAAHPIGSVIMRTDNTNPRNMNGFGAATWSNFSTQTMGSFTVYYWRRTA